MKFYAKSAEALNLKPQEIKDVDLLTIKNENVSKKRRLVTFKDLLKVYLVMCFGFALFIPEIYIKNQIYYTSRDINTLLNEYAVLLEENRDLQKKIELIRYKNQVLDTLDIK